MINNPLLGREPVVTISTVVALLLAILPAFGWTAEQVGAVAAVLVLLGGVAEALLLRRDRLLPVLVGLGKAVLAGTATFGLHLPGNVTAAAIAVLTVVTGLQMRQQVVPRKSPYRDGGGLIDWRYIPGQVPELVPPGAVPTSVPLRAERDYRDAPPLPQAHEGDGEREAPGR